MYKLGFIGVGNMGGALLRGCSAKVPGKDIIITDPDAIKTAALADELGCTVGTAQQTALYAEYLFIGVKPQMACDAFDSVRDTLLSRQTPAVIVSMMAGVDTEKIRTLSGGTCPVIRIMPNVCASVGEAMIIAASNGASDGQISEFTDFMSGTGAIDFIPEKLIDAGTAVQGCGPAYVCMFVEALADGAVKCGIPRQKAYEYAIRTIKGTAVLLEKSGRHPAEVKDSVTSPAGSTIEGVEALEKGGFRHTVMDAVVKAYEKNQKLK